MARDNNFDFIRLIGALLVIVGHSFVLTGRPPPALLGMGVHSLGVKIFFVVSGYLVTESWLRDPSFLRFLMRRSLRIFPALAFCVLLTVFLLGPLASGLSCVEYFTSAETYDYLSNIALYVRYGLPGVFEANTLPRAVNGSLWTLPVEFAAYLLLPCVLLLLRLRCGGWLAGLVGIGFIGTEIATRGVSAAAQPIIYATGVISGLQLVAYFVAGAAYRVLRLERFLSLQWAMLLVLLGIVLPSDAGTLPLLQYTTIPYVTLAFAMPRFPRFSWISKVGDFSYGLYLYAFPMQQFAVVLIGSGHSAYLNMAFATSTSAMLAAISWFYVERPTQVLKPRRPTSFRAPLAANAEGGA